MKYIIVESEKTKGHDIRPKYPIIFSDHLIHRDMVPKRHFAISAGDISLIGRSGAICSGQSRTLGISSNAEKDSELITKWLTFGEAIMIMASCDYDQHD